MNRKSSLAAITMTAWMLLIFTVILGTGSPATAAKSPADFTLNQFAAPVEQTSPAVRLAQFTNPPAGTMLGGAGMFAPPDIINAPGGSGGMYTYPDLEPDVWIAPPRIYNPYRRCPYGGFDCDL